MDPAKYPTTHRTVPKTNNHLTPNASRPEAGKLFGVLGTLDVLIGSHQTHALEGVYG